MPTADENPSCREMNGDETVRRGRIEPLHDGRRESESTRPDLARLDRGCNTHALCGRSAPPPARIYTTSGLDLHHLGSDLHHRSSLATDVCRAVGLAVGDNPAATAGR